MINSTALRILTEIWNNYFPPYDSVCINGEFIWDETTPLEEAFLPVRKLLENKFSDIFLIDDIKIDLKENRKYFVEVFFRMTEFSGTDEGSGVFLKKLVSIVLAGISEHLLEFDHVKSQAIISGGIVSRIMRYFIDIRHYGRQTAIKKFGADDFDVDIFVFGDTKGIIPPTGSKLMVNNADDMTINRYRQRGDEIVKIRSIYNCVGKMTLFEKKVNIQIILYESADAPDDIINTFDFVHNQPWFDMKENLFWISEEQFESIRTKTLLASDRYENEIEMINEARVNKYLKQGYKVA